MSTPITSTVFPGSEEEYLFRDNRIADSETGAATDEEYGLIKLPEGASLDENGRLRMGSEDLIATIGPATDEKMGLVKTGFTATKKALPVLVDENNDAYVEVGAAMEGVSSSGMSYPFGKCRWMTFDFSADNKKSIKIKKGVKIKLNITTDDGVEGRWYNATEDMHYDFTTTIEANTQPNGNNFYVYLVPGEEEDSVDIVCSANSTFPNDISSTYTANNTRKIGQFHTMCVAMPSTQTAKTVSAHGSKAVGDKFLVKRYNSGAEDDFYGFYNKTITSITTNAKADLTIVEHPLAGFAAGDILPESVFCLSFRPFSDPAGMVFDPDSNRCYDIYLQSGTGLLTASEYNKTHTVSRQQQNHQDDFMQVGKRLCFSAEFTSMAAGSNEGTNIVGSTDKTVVGGHLDTAGDRMTSFIGVEEACGYLDQWSEDISSIGSTAGGSVYDGLGWFGYTAGSCLCILVGGGWNHASMGPGSRARWSFNEFTCSMVYDKRGGRGTSSILRGN